MYSGLGGSTWCWLARLASGSHRFNEWPDRYIHHQSTGTFAILGIRMYDCTSQLSILVFDDEYMLRRDVSAPGFVRKWFEHSPPINRWVRFV